jgi:hypothetical protein|eukprot:COSAG03_NODE_10_length_23829_cov_21.731395_4_plen_59_part_00
MAWVALPDSTTSLLACASSHRECTACCSGASLVSVLGVCLFRHFTMPRLGKFCSTRSQ